MMSGSAQQRVARRAVIAGRVQGVWFRDSARRRAESLGVAGWARNRLDGTVEVWAQLEISREELDAMTPGDFKRAWSARNQRLQDGGVFAHIGELADKLGSKALTELSPSQAIRALEELEHTRLGPA
jgi:acylphosphatase